MQCSSASGACRRGVLAASTAASAAITANGAAAAASWLPQDQRRLSTQKPYGLLRGPLPCHCGVGPWGAACRGRQRPSCGVCCSLLNSKTRGPLPSPAATVSGAACCFASAAAAVPLAHAAVAAAARQTAALAASGAAAAEELQQVPIGKGPHALKAGPSEGGSEAAACLPEGAPEGAVQDSALQHKQQQQQQQQQDGSVSGDSKKGLSLAAVVWGAGALGCSIWAVQYMRQHNLSFTGRLCSFVLRAVYVHLSSRWKQQQHTATLFVYVFFTQTSLRISGDEQTPK